MIHNHFLMALAITSLCMVFTYPKDFRCTFSKGSSSSGVCKYGNETVKDVNASGLINLNGTNVTDCATIHGCLYATQAHLNKLHGNGSANLEECTVHGNAHINGSLNGKGNIFKGVLTISSNKVCLDATSTQSIEIRKITRDNNQQVVILESSSIVMGDIIFAAGNGVVVVDCNSKLTGNVIGGVVVKKDDYDKDSQ